MTDWSGRNHECNHSRRPTEGTTVWRLVVIMSNRTQSRLSSLLPFQRFMNSDSLDCVQLDITIIIGLQISLAQTGYPQIPTRLEQLPTGRHQPLPHAELQCFMAWWISLPNSPLRLLNYPNHSVNCWTSSPLGCGEADKAQHFRS